MWEDGRLEAEEADSPDDEMARQDTMREDRDRIARTEEREFDRDAGRTRRRQYSFKIGDAVYVKRARAGGKLDTRYYGKCYIEAVLERDNYKLRGFEGHMEPVFHVSKLKPIREQDGDDTEKANDGDRGEWGEQGSETYLVERLVKLRGKGGQEEAKVVWRGWPLRCATWVRVNSLIKDGFRDEVQELRDALHDKGSRKTEDTSAEVRRSTRNRESEGPSGKARPCKESSRHGTPLHADDAKQARTERAKHRERARQKARDGKMNEAQNVTR